MKRRTTARTGLRHTAALAASVAVLAAAAGCSVSNWLGKPSSTGMVRLTATQSGQIVNLAEYQYLSVELPAAKTGFRWVLTKKPDPRVLKFVDRRPAVVRADLLGEKTDEFRFFAVGPGFTSFALTCMPGRDVAAAAATFTLTVKVSD